MKTIEVKNLTARTSVYPDGQKCDAAVLEYSEPVETESLSVETFEVLNRTVLSCSVCEDPDGEEPAALGRFVAVRLSLQDKAASTITVIPDGRFGSPKLTEASVSLRQKKPFRTADGEVAYGEALPGSDLRTGSYLTSSRVRNLLADDFQQGMFEDLPYNLFIPKSYDGKKRYPLVLFIHDAGTCSEDARVTLAQGIGAVIWAGKEEQKKHECFVLAPQFAPPPIVNDDFESTEGVEKAKRLLDFIVSAYRVDVNRIYLTGQSMGCMSGCELNVRYPDLFAASLLVAGQWNPQTMGQHPALKLWIFVSEGDEKAYPGMNAVTAAMEKSGAKVAREHWSAKASQEEWRKAGNRMIESGANVLYTAFEKETVADGSRSHPGEHHVTTWKIAYQIEVARDWLFSQRRQED